MPALQEQDQDCAGTHAVRRQAAFPGAHVDGDCLAHVYQPVGYLGPLVALRGWAPQTCLVENGGKQPYPAIKLAVKRGATKQIKFTCIRFGQGDVLAFLQEVLSLKGSLPGRDGHYSEVGFGLGAGNVSALRGSSETGSGGDYLFVFCVCLFACRYKHKQYGT